MPLQLTLLTPASVAAQSAIMMVIRAPWGGPPMATPGLSAMTEAAPRDGVWCYLWLRCQTHRGVERSFLWWSAEDSHACVREQIRQSHFKPNRPNQTEPKWPSVNQTLCKPNQTEVAS